MHQGWPSVTANDHIRRLTEDIASAAVAVIVVGDQAPVTENLQVKVGLHAAASSLERVQLGGIVDLHRAQNTANFGVDVSLSGGMAVPGDFRDDIRMRSRNRER